MWGSVAKDLGGKIHERYICCKCSSCHTRAVRREFIYALVGEAISLPFYRPIFKKSCGRIISSPTAYGVGVCLALSPRVILERSRPTLSPLRKPPSRSFASLEDDSDGGGMNNLVGRRSEGSRRQIHERYICCKCSSCPTRAVRRKVTAYKGSLYTREGRL